VSEYGLFEDAGVRFPRPLASEALDPPSLLFVADGAAVLTIEELQ